MKNPTVVGVVMALGIVAVILVFLFLPLIYAETSEFPDANGNGIPDEVNIDTCLLYTSPSPRDLSTSRMPSSA